MSYNIGHKSGFDRNSRIHIGRILASEDGKMPTVFSELFAKAGIENTESGAVLPIEKVDAALVGIDVDVRITIKSALQHAGYHLR